MTDVFTGDVWIFGYGSLMWRPGFDYLESCHARLHGYHRAFCVYSHVHRGTPEQPGLVFGLDRGGSCRGIGYRIAGRNAQTVVDYLREREQVTKIYVEATGPITLLDDRARRVTALYYVVDRRHHQYAQKIDFETQARLIAGASGQSGVNADYLENTVRHLREVGIEDRYLTRLWHEVQRRLADSAVS